jgi:molecular chaperone HtpG
MKDEDFYEKVKNIIIYKNLEGEFKPLNDYFGEEIAEEDAKNGVQPQAIYYVSDEAQQAQYVVMFKEAGLDAILCDTFIDSHFVSFIEYKNPKKCRFVRIDADVNSALKGEAEVTEEEQKEIVDLFKKHLVNQTIEVRVERFKSGKIPAVVNVEEFMRRMAEMGGMYGMGEMDPMNGAVLVLNLTNPVISGLLMQSEEKQKVVVNQIYYLAMLSYKPLKPEELSDFVAKTTELLFNYCK